MYTILILSYSKLHSDPRVLRQIQVLEKDFDVYTVGLSASGKSKTIHISAKAKKKNTKLDTLYEALLSLMQCDDELYWRSPHVSELFDKICGCFKKKIPDVLICNEIGYLPLAVRLSETFSSKLMVDLHEYAPTELEENFFWRLRFRQYYTRQFKKYLPKANAVTTVCFSICQLLKKKFNVHSEVIYNAPFYRDLTPSELSPRRIRLVHHGAAIRSRHLEIMIDSMKYLDDTFELNLILIPTDLNYIKELKNLSRGLHVNFHLPVPTEEIPGYLNQFDIGIFILPPVNFNYSIALPNKLFEFIQARLAIVVGPSIEMASIVKKYDLGKVTQGFSAEEVALSIKSVNKETWIHYKHQSNAISKELSFEKSATILNKLITDILK
ncbi:MAG: hypothetical protein FJZ78_01095 [Bacteroidetes bacterium]|nr:hypothetical protein [Bacteroidota bacterium]